MCDAGELLRLPDLEVRARPDPEVRAWRVPWAARTIGMLCRKRGRRGRVPLVRAARSPPRPPTQNPWPIASPDANSSRGQTPGNTRGDPRVDPPTGAFPAKVKGAPHVARMPSEVVVDEFENPAGRRGLRSFARRERARSCPADGAARGFESWRDIGSQGRQARRRSGRAWRVRCRFKT